jgi:hypothetical protein
MPTESVNRWTIILLAVVAGLVVAPGRAASSGVSPTAQGVVLRLKAGGLPVGKYKIYSAASDPNHLLGRPGQYTSKVNFRDSRIKKSDALGEFDMSAGGSVEVFKSESEAQRRFDYVKAVTQSSSFLVEYDYLEAKVLLRLSNVLTPAQAKRYETTLRRLY